MLYRVQKIISNAGYCSRRKAEKLIEQGFVKVNNKKITLGDKASENDKIMIHGKQLKIDKKVYLAFYKPRHVLTTLYDPGQKPTIMKFLSKLSSRVFPVGRLDYDAEGLLLLTNDGDFANLVMHPRYETSKLYHVTLTSNIRKGNLEPLARRIRLKDGFVKVDFYRLLKKNIVEVRIHEGRNKVVKRIFKKLGFHVKRLKRVQVSYIKLGKLKPGRWRYLNKREVGMILEKE